jgi:hypothetical protein
MNGFPTVAATGVSVSWQGVIGFSLVVDIK